MMELSSIDLKGKEIILVQTHTGWQGHCFEDMENCVMEARLYQKKKYNLTLREEQK